jgi:hypothetical protein
MFIDEERFDQPQTSRRPAMAARTGSAWACRSRHPG